ncbi:putative helicase/relaxase (plasmid) [Legionella adelaidensis]|uniref:Putative helicase/relaxase n=1 Tax=Legionella adelaidensis TaxID=45056 RepID=A0A0W0R0Y8_9GAMM|nr:TraI domain-containing protein [Legionella adelaidensis]KTC64635.1 putative helicase/relaxase [Legionella adelaidensis]VEH86103.1 putative helicase/relaxase [Legionella adelaidensis]
MFHKPHKTPNAKPLKDLTAIVSPAQLLADAKRQQLLEKIEDFSGFEQTRFNTLCTPLIHNLINHCQSLPETYNSYYAQSGGLLDHALNRTEAALDLFRHFIIQESTELSEEQKLWMYALFSAGILQGIGKLQVEFKIGLYDVNGQLIKTWNPVLESLAAVGSYYQYSFLGPTDEDFRKRLNLLLARMLMPAAGFNLIASNADVLAVWLSLLNEDWQSAGTLGAILVRADAIAIQRYFNEFLHTIATRRGRINRISTFVDTNPENLIDKEKAIGIEFIQWLTKSLEDGQIMINKAPLLMVPGGLLISPEIYKYFVREHPEYKNWQAIQNGFLSLKLHSVATDGTVEARFEQTATQQMHTGVVFSNYAIALPETMKIHNVNTGKISTISATELIHSAQHNNNFRQPASPTSSQLAHLNAHGKWEQVEAQDALRPGSHHSG